MFFKYINNKNILIQFWTHTHLDPSINVHTNYFQFELILFQGKAVICICGKLYNYVFIYVYKYWFTYTYITQTFLSSDGFWEVVLELKNQSLWRQKMILGIIHKITWSSIVKLIVLEFIKEAWIMYNKLYKIKMISFLESRFLTWWVNNS